MAMDGLPEGVPRSGRVPGLGAGAASPGSPDLETAVAVVQRGERER